MGIPIIDLFAGPGGLGEGFTSLLNERHERVFKIRLSIEKDEFAHQTLTLRAFVRQFPSKSLPPAYYEFLQGKITLNELFAKHPEQFKNAVHEAKRIELGKFPVDLLDKMISQALNKAKDWVLIGGPPCQAYSIVGRSRNGGIDPNDERVYLYREYYRILAVHNPPMFIMENVKGLLSSRINDKLIFHQILSDLRNPQEAYIQLRGNDLSLKCPGYNIYSLVKKYESTDAFGSPVFNIEDYTIRSEEYGIPQTRHRVILFGVRKDLNISKIPILKKQGKVLLEKVLSGLPKIRSGLSKLENSNECWQQTLSDFLLSQHFKNIKDQGVKKLISEIILGLETSNNGTGSRYIKKKIGVKYRSDWYLDEKMEGICNHESRGHIKEDLYRYLYASCFAVVYGISPKLCDFPKSLLPSHRNIKSGIENNKFGDRFRVQLYGQPAKTITSHISKDGHYYIHPDSSQCRSLTVREAARIQTFPDNYFFCGPRTAQYHQVGNAVPPLLAFQIAEVVFGVFDDLFNKRLKSKKMMITSTANEVE